MWWFNNNKNMRFLNNKYLKLFLVLGVAFAISNFSIKNVFIAESPKLNPFFTQNMMAKVNSLRLKTTNFIASINFNQKKSSTDQVNNFNNSKPTSFTLTQQQITDALKAPLKKVSQGVYAGETDNIQVYEIRSNEIDYLEYTFNVNGKEIKIKVPKDQQPPSQETVDALYR